MSDKPAVFQGSYADLRFIKGRKVAAITVEIPIEAAAAFVDVFGAPNPAAEIPVVLARLAADAVRSGLTSAAQHRAEMRHEPLDAAPPRERKAWADLPPSQQAAMRCEVSEFQRFMIEAKDYPPTMNVAECVRDYCGVRSRAELNTEPEAVELWRALDDEFFKWQRGAR